MRFTHIPFLSTILRPDYTNLNLYSYILNGLLLGVFLGIAVIHTAVNRHFKGVLGGVGNNSNTVIVYLFFHAGIKFLRVEFLFYHPRFYKTTQGPLRYYFTWLIILL